MRTVLVLLALVGVGLFLVDLPRRTSFNRLERRMWRHVDGVIGARKLEGDRRASRRRLVGFFSRDLANLLYPPQQLQGAMAYPGRRRQRRYVRLGLRSKPWPRRFHRWDITWVELHWTSEAAANSPTFWEWIEKGKPTEGGGVAQALGLEWKPGLFERQVDRSRDLVRLVRTKPAVVPDDVTAEEELA
jgi:hypothetical protein